MAGAQSETVPQMPRGLLCEQPRVTPGLLLAWAPDDVIAADRVQVLGHLVVGRGSNASWCIRDDKMSRAHFEIMGRARHFVVRDLGSRNGTFVDGEAVVFPRIVRPGSIIRAGRCVCVVVEDLSALPLVRARRSDRLAGRFFSPLIVHDLEVASYTGRHVLLHGEKGSGKDEAAQIFHRFSRRLGRNGPLIKLNGAQFSSEQDAMAALFGVARSGFTSIGPRRGAIEYADGGILFLDEVQELPLRVQRSLSRFVEDGMLQRVGGTERSEVDVRIIFGTSAAVKDGVEEDVLACDLLTRLHQVSLPSLRDRRADIPDIFIDLLRRSAPSGVARALENAFDEELVELLMANPYRQGNVHELAELASLVAARVLDGEPPWIALVEALADDE